MKNYKNDQLVMPISLIKGLAFRAVADIKDIPYAELLRSLLVKGLEADPAIKNLYEVEIKRLSQLNELQLLQMKADLRLKDNHKPL